MNVNRASVEQIVTRCLADMQQEMATTFDVTSETRLYGANSPLDSTGLVSFIVDVESRLDAELGLTVVLADERALSQKHSPFRDVRALVDYILVLAAEIEVPSVS